MNNWIITIGGSGSEYLVDLFEITYDFDKHQRFPNQVPENAKIAYLYSDPYNLALSHYNRGFLRLGHYFQSGRTVKNDILFKDLSFDPWDIEGHFSNWWDSQRHESLFIRYESLPTTIKDLCKWFDIDVELKWKPRLTDWRCYDEITKVKLEELWGDYRRRLLVLPDVVIK